MSSPSTPSLGLPGYQPYTKLGTPQLPGQAALSHLYNLIPVPHCWERRGWWGTPHSHLPETGPLHLLLLLCPLAQTPYLTVVPGLLATPQNLRNWEGVVPPCVSTVFSYVQYA